MALRTRSGRAALGSETRPSTRRSSSSPTTRGRRSRWKAGRPTTSSTPHRPRRWRRRWGRRRPGRTPRGRPHHHSRLPRRRPRRLACTSWWCRSCSAAACASGRASRTCIQSSRVEATSSPAGVTHVTFARRQASEPHHVAQPAGARGRHCSARPGETEQEGEPPAERHTRTYTASCRVGRLPAVLPCAEARRPLGSPRPPGHVDARGLCRGAAPAAGAWPGCDHCSYGGGWVWASWWPLRSSPPTGSSTSTPWSAAMSSRRRWATSSTRWSRLPWESLFFGSRCGGCSGWLSGSASWPRLT